MTLNDTSNIATIVGTGVTIIISAQLGLVKRFYRRRLFLPKLTRELTTHARNLDVALTNKNSSHVRRHLHECDANLERILKHGDTPLKKRIGSIRSAIAYSGSLSGQTLLESGRTIHGRIVGVLVSTTALSREDDAP